MNTIFHRVVSLELALLSPLLDDFISWGESLLSDKKPFLNLALAIDELFMNSLHHGSSQKTEVEVSAQVFEPIRVIELRYRDWGQAFDPLRIIAEKKKQALEDLSLLDRPIGGVGLSLISALVKEFSYCRDGEANLLILRNDF